MLKVFMPLDNENERLYVLEVILNEWLGIKYMPRFEPDRNVIQFILPNGHQLLIEDHFFRHHPKRLTYLSKENIPQKAKVATASDIPFLSEQDITILFGEPKVIIEDNKIQCGVDVFATTFFMLTRWEELVNPARDQHDRFPAAASIAYQEQFLHRPKVDEYVEMLWNMLKHLGINQARKQRNYQALVTHDVDTPLQWHSNFSLIRKIGGDLIKRQSIPVVIGSLSGYWAFKQGKSKDPFDTFDYLMDMSEQHGLQSYFFFLCGGKTKFDKGFLRPSQPFIQQLFRRIHDRGHIIGFHPSYDSYQNETIFQSELQELQQHSPQPITCGRQHFLRFSVPYTWRLWEKYELKWESSMYYPEQAGFRCGTSHGFPVFDILERKQLQLKELPLTAMDVTYKNYSAVQPEEMMDELSSLLFKTKKYKGRFCLLWHNSNISDKGWKPYFRNYEFILESLNAVLDIG